MSSHYVCEPDGVFPVKLGTEGWAASPPTTVITQFRRAVAEYGDEDALKVERGGEWQTWSWRQYYDDVVRAAKSLLKVGMPAHTSVNIIGFNSPEWLIADVAAIMVGGFAAGVYTTNQHEACAYQAQHSGAQAIFMENAEQVVKYLKVKDELPDVKLYVQYLGEPSEEARQAGVVSWSEFMKMGEDISDDDLEARVSAIQPGHCATLIYTSGTTSNPKAVMISHDNLTWTAMVAVDWCPLPERGHSISYLALSHVAAQMIDIHGPMVAGIKTWFARPDALKGSLAATMRHVRPTHFLGVPRVWEKIQEKMQAMGAESGSAKQAIAAWAKSIGLRGNLAKQSGESVPWGWTLANALVFNAVKARLGLDRCVMIASAAAPIMRDTLNYFLSLNVVIHEIYGMSECTGPATIGHDAAARVGTVGLPIHGTELKIDQPDESGQGEVCYRGRHVFMGYLKDEAKTREAIDDEGWLHSGDLGRLDKDGFLTITGRIKEIIITAGGENVAPVPIEDRVKAEAPILSNAMLVGDKRKFLTMLVTLKCEMDPDTGDPTDKLSSMAKQHFAAIGCTATTVSEAMKLPEVRQAIENAIKRANEHAVSRAARVQKFEIIPQDFSIPGGELTPTMKLKRMEVMKKYAAVVDAMYADSE